jgi:hypothetical protein
MPDATKRQLLYTFYLDLCKKREFVPIKHNKFTKEFLNHYVEADGVKLVHKKGRLYVIGLVLKPEVLEIDYGLGEFFVNKPLK